MNGTIQIVHRNMVIDTCDSISEAVNIAKHHGINDCGFIYACEIAYLDEGKLMIQDDIDSIAAQEIEEALNA